MSLPETFLNELKARIGLSTVIGRRVKLVRAGRELKGCCPFHGEKTPSFFVNEDKGFYHCFGCGAHGDVIRFVMDMDSLGFPEAVRALAAEAGLEVPVEPAASSHDRRRDGLQQLVAHAADWYAGQLRTDAGAAARGYLQQRGVSGRLARQFGLGYAPGAGQALLAAIRAATGATDAQLRDSGLAGEADGRLFDRFRNRLMFPIHDGRGRAVGFGGRILGDGQPKYLNSADGALFHKGNLLYNYHRAAPLARQSGRLLVVEGYLDVIGLAAAGFAPAVAPLGTALTEAQMALAWRLVPEPVLAFDGDAAGRRAALRAATRALPLLAAGKSLAFATLPAGVDPDDLARTGGLAAIESLLQGAIPLERFLFDAELAATNLDTPERRAGFRARLRALANDIADTELRRDYLATWLGRADAAGRPPRVAPGATPRSRSARQRRWPPDTPPPARAETRARAGQPTEIHMGMLLRLLADTPDLAEQFAEELAELPLHSPALARARDHLLAGRPPGELLAGYRALSFGRLAGAELQRELATTLAQCLATHQIAALEQPAVAAQQSLAEVYARNRAAALDVLARRDIVPGVAADGAAKSAGKPPAKY